MRAVRYVGRIFPVRRSLGEGGRSASSVGPIVLVRRSLGEGGRSAVPAQRLLSALLVALACAAPASAQEVIEYYATDHLGSIRVVFDAAGNVIARADYLPFGEELFAPTGPLPAERFTGQARDGEAGQDYFHARMYQSRTGRFNAVDPIYAGLFDPQQWNRYVYARNNPLNIVDPLGLCNVGISPDLVIGGFVLPPCRPPTRGAGYGDGGGGYGVVSWPGGNTGGVQAGAEGHAWPPAGRGARGAGRGPISTEADRAGAPSPVPAPIGPDGRPAPPPVQLPPGKNGKPNSWQPTPGTAGRPTRWVPLHPIADPRGAQPNGSWDPRGHFDVHDGRGQTRRFLPNGVEVDHFNNPVRVQTPSNWLYRFLSFPLIVVNPYLFDPNLRHGPTYFEN